MSRIITAITALFIFGNAGAQNFDDLTFGTDSTLDVMTWNIEHFPKNGQTTMNYVTEVIEAMQLDVVAMQEIDDIDAFDDFIADLNGYSGFRGNADYARLGYIYKTDEMQVNEIYEIITNNSQAFSRPPIVMELTYDGIDMVLINNHFKCCGDGVLDEDDPWDEESRRLLAVELLTYQLENTFADDRVVLMGDLNDVLTDNSNNNVFQDWLDDSDNYLFADMFIAEGDDEDWSYPTWPSHLDHILLTSEVFADDSELDWTCNIVKLDDYMSGWSAYDSNISDHRPVSIKLDPITTTSVGVDNLDTEAVALTNYPNPFSGQTTIAAYGIYDKADVFIYGMDGKLLERIVIQNGVEYTWDSSIVGPGVYFAHVVVEGKSAGIRKMVVLK